MERKLIILCLVLTLILIFTIVYRRKREVEHFQTNYLKDFHNYLENIKTFNQKKRDKREKIEEQKNKKYTNDKQMTREKILITGATSGIGYAIAKYITKYKCPIFITGKNEESLKKLQVELEEFTKPIYYGKYDLTKNKSIDKLYKQVKKTIGIPTILFNCAIFTKGSAYISTKSDEERSSLPTNPFELVEMIRRANSLNDATIPSDAIDDALKSFNDFNEKENL